MKLIMLTLALVFILGCSNIPTSGNFECDTYRLCTRYRGDSYDRECFQVQSENLDEICLTIDWDVNLCANYYHSYRITCE